MAWVAASLGGVLLLRLAYAARGILSQLVIAVVLAMPVEPLVQALERRGLRRGSAVGIGFGLLALSVVGFAYLPNPGSLQVVSAEPLAWRRGEHPANSPQERAR